jgi:hypothetical protein
MTLQTHEILSEITTYMKQMLNIYANEQHMCHTSLDIVYYAGKEQAFREALAKTQKIIAKYEEKEGESWKNSTDK